MADAVLDELFRDRRPDAVAIDTLKTLAMDAVEKANSGHPGMPMGAAPMAHVLWTRHLSYDPSDAAWPDRDRFLLSAGHGSMLLYGLLHLAGFGLSIDDLKDFRQWGSLTPGHPEYGHTIGVETTTGPLGAGSSNAVGMAMAEAFLGATFNRPGHTIVDHYTYALVSDGDLMEGVGSEAASLAGHLRLGKLVFLYDDNSISIEGSTDLTFTEDVAKRFEAYGWQVITVSNGEDIDAIDAALQAARADTERPTLIRVRTVIAAGSPNKAGTASSHGSPLGAEEVKLTKEALGWPADVSFAVPAVVKDLYAARAAQGAAARANWQERMVAYRQAYPDLAAQWERALAGKLPEGWQEALPTFEPGEKIATRAASGKVLNALAQLLPTLIGGSADLAPSNNTYLKGFDDFEPGQYAGRNLRFGVREHGMGGILNGMSLHGGLFVYGGTFFVFSDYMRPAIRLAALAHIPVIYVLTHDSIGLGEDGPTHQPIEHLASLRAMPNLTLIRPSDAAETAVAWAVALERHDGPTALVLTRQNLPVLDRSLLGPAEGLRRGGYVVKDSQGDEPQAIIIATGSEVAIALEAEALLAPEGVNVRVVALPSWELFAQQDDAYRQRVLPAAVTARLAVEAGSSFGWERYVGRQGRVVGIDHFGASAPAEVLYREFGLTAENVAAQVRAVLADTAD